MRGDKELASLDRIREKVFQVNPINSKSAFEVSEEEFAGNHVLYISSLALSHYYGMSEEDCKTFENALREAKPNPSLNCFPDFVFANGFIEHFEITSSKSNRRGYDHKRKHARFDKIVDQEQGSFMRTMEKSPSFGRIQSNSWEFEYPEHSYEYLKKSFMETWDSHISSLIKYENESGIGIFLIDYPEVVLGHYVDFDVKDNAIYGDLLFRDNYKWYRLSRDKELLQYIYEYKNQIRYVIFQNEEYYEIFATKNIPELMKLLPWDYRFYPCQVTEVHSVYGTSIPVHNENED